MWAGRKERKDKCRGKSARGAAESKWGTVRVPIKRRNTTRKRKKLRKASEPQGGGVKPADDNKRQRRWDRSEGSGRSRMRVRWTGGKLWMVNGIGKHGKRQLAALKMRPLWLEIKKV